MLKTFAIPAALGLAAAAALLPTTASAQSYGVYVGSGYPGYGYGGRGYYAPGYDPYGYYDDRRAAWIAHERWEQRRRWESDRARRHWEHERWEHRYWHGDDDDD
ncbi:hypothetical protein [Flavisphingomonas formosensis]|uniref:hypothetical protein n=1 Tax=Flavisphingomonas formosensis TaxID=861534 RepID=UPI0012FCE553|nr:hypothetical protein [Sphingomonas formosensis]